MGFKQRRTVWTHLHIYVIFTKWRVYGKTKENSQNKQQNKLLSIILFNKTSTVCHLCLYVANAKLI